MAGTLEKQEDKLDDNHLVEKQGHLMMTLFFLVGFIIKYKKLQKCLKVKEGQCIIYLKVKYSQTKYLSEHHV